jgi:hypothetical protein
MTPFSIKGNDLTGGMYSRIGPPGSDHTGRLAGNMMDGVLDSGLYSRDAFSLSLEAKIGRPVIG